MNRAHASSADAALHRHAACCRCRASEGGFGGPAARDHWPPDLLLEPRHMDIALRLDLPARRADACVTLTLVARAEGARALDLHAVDLRDVAAEDAAGNPISQRYDGATLRLRWDAPFARGESRRVTLRYAVVEPVSGLFFSSPSAEYPHLATFAATDHETERARHWLPCVDLPNVRTTLTLRLTADAALTAIANGALEGAEVHDDGTKTTTWKLDQPCPSYLICFAVGDFTEADGGEFDGRPIAFFATRDHTPDDLQRAFGKTRDILTWMTQKLDHPLPWPKYYQFALPEFGGAMENISLVSWDDVFVLDATWARETQWLTDVVNVHEMAHTWFGDLVVCRDFAHAWLKESWATYIETCWLEDTYGQDELHYNLYRDAQAYFDEAEHRYARPIVTRRFASSWQMYDRHLYPGGACRLHTLRAELGDAVFWEGVRAYLKRFAFQVVETDDFRRVMEEASGRSLGRFFDQWLYRPGFPRLKVEFSYDDEACVGTFTVTQEQVREGEEKEGDVPIFHLSTDVGWEIDGVCHTLPVTLDRRVHTIRVPMAKAPTMVRFDPLARVLHKLSFNPGDDMLARQLRHAPDVIGRVLAAWELSLTGKRRAVDLLLDAWRSEPFWGVRREIVAALAKIPLSAALTAVATIIAEERDDMVVDGVMRVAASLRDPALAAAVQARLDAGDLGYRAAAIAWEALGAQRERAPLEALRQAATTSTWGGIVTAGAWRGLAASGEVGLMDFMLEHLRYGALPFRVRRAAVVATGTLARGLAEHARERVRLALEDLLRDPAERVRSGAAEALAIMQARDALPALEAFRATLSHQARVTFDATLAELRAGGDPQLDALRKQVEALDQRCRKLNDQLQELDARVNPPRAAADEEPPPAQP